MHLIVHLTCTWCECSQTIGILRFAHQLGEWGTQHAIRVCNWALNLERPRNQLFIAAALYNWHDAAWLEERKLSPDIGGILRPGTQSSNGFVHVRWDESLIRARSRVPHNQPT